MGFVDNNQRLGTVEGLGLALTLTLYALCDIWSKYHNRGYSLQVFMLLIRCKLVLY